jgi:hypothetical protein
VSDYGLDIRAIGVRYHAGAKDFSSNLRVQTSSEDHPASCTMGTQGKAQSGHDTDCSPPSSAEVKNEYELYLLFPQAPPWHVAGVLCFASLSHMLQFRKWFQVITNAIKVIFNFLLVFDLRLFYLITSASIVTKCLFNFLPTKYKVNMKKLNISFPGTEIIFF